MPPHNTYINTVQRNIHHSKNFDRSKPRNRELNFNLPTISLIDTSRPVVVIGARTRLLYRDFPSLLFHAIVRRQGIHTRTWRGRERALFERSRIFRASPTNYSSVDRSALCSHVDDPDVGHRLTKHRRHNEVWHGKVVVVVYTGIYRHFEEGRRESGGPLSDTPRQTSDGGGFDGGFPFWRSQAASSPSLLSLSRPQQGKTHRAGVLLPAYTRVNKIARKIPDRISPLDWFPRRRDVRKKVKKFKVIE